MLARLGPDPLRNRPGDRDAFAAAVRAKRTPLAALLMDQKVIAGVGNVYRAELLFRQGLDPWLPGTGLSAEAAGRLWDDTVAMMSDGVRDGRIITTPPRYWSGSAGGTPPGGHPAGSARPGRGPLRLPAAGPRLPGLRNAGGPDRPRCPQALLVPVLPGVLTGLVGPEPHRLLHNCPSDAPKGPLWSSRWSGHEKSPSGEGLFRHISEGTTGIEPA